MGCGSSKSTTTVHSKKQLQNGTTEKISKSHPTETTKQNGVAHLTATNNSNSEKIIKPEHHSETIIPINGNKVTKEEINQQNLSNSRTSDRKYLNISNVCLMYDNYLMNFCTQYNYLSKY